MKISISPLTDDEWFVVGIHILNIDELIDIVRACSNPSSVLIENRNMARSVSRAISCNYSAGLD